MDPNIAPTPAEHSTSATQEPQHAASPGHGAVSPNKEMDTAESTSHETTASVPESQKDPAAKDLSAEKTDLAGNSSEAEAQRPDSDGPSETARPAGKPESTGTPGTNDDDKKEPSPLLDVKVEVPETVAAENNKALKPEGYSIATENGTTSQSVRNGQSENPENGSTKSSAEPKTDSASETAAESAPIQTEASGEVEKSSDIEVPRETNASAEIKKEVDASAEIKNEVDASGDAMDVETDTLDGVVKSEATPGKHSRSESPSSSVKKARTELVVVPHKKPDLVYSPLRTGLVYDVRMRYHAKIFTSYFEYIDPHPEDPRRIYRIYKILAEAGLIQDPTLSGSDDIGPLMVKIPVREATAAEILEVHTQEHLQFISSTEKMTRDQLLDETERGDSIYVNNDSFLSAKLSCGGSIEACRAVVEGKVKNSLAIVRPPGHHAEPNAPGGFCLFSNVAVAAKNILKTYPESVRRIVILDWDIHHGNGTQRAFYDDPRVLYISIHRFENGKFYPGTKYGGADKVGEGKGEGYSVNIPWSEAGVGDADYMYAFHKVVMPIMSEFDPDLVIVSAGFDAADGDIIGQCHVTPAGYGQLTHMLKAIARGKLTVILEGGYNLVSISESALGVAKVLVGEPPEATISTQPRIDTLETINEVMRIQSKYWKSMQPGISSHVFEDSYDLTGTGLTNFAEPIRAYQAQELFSKYKFVNLPILDEKSDKSSAYFTTDLPAHLEDLVLASDNIDECGTVVISVHDSPEVWAYINPINGSIECSSSVVLEHPLTRFIEKIKSELKTENIPDTVGYIDVNIPSSNIESGSSKNSYNATIFAQELLLWIWDNYLNYFSSLKKVVFIGYGDAYQSIVHLYAKRPSQEVKELVRGTVVFASRSNLKPIVPVMDESMVDWYYQNSVIFASYMNACWAGSNGKGDGEDSGKRPRRKFGRVLKASVDSAWDITNEKFDEGIDFIVDSIADYSD